MTKEDLHKMIEQDQPNICQIEAIRDGKTVYSDTWNNYTRDYFPDYKVKFSWWTQGAYGWVKNAPLSFLLSFL